MERYPGYPIQIWQYGDPTKFTCFMCKQIYRNPVKLLCNKSYCYDCALSNYKFHGTCVKCPPHTKCYESVLTRDCILVLDMERYRVNCVHFGCNWSGLFKEFGLHYEICQHRKYSNPLLERINELGSILDEYITEVHHLRMQNSLLELHSRNRESGEDFVWKVNAFSTIDRTISAYSYPFYRDGYKLCVKIHFTITHISLFIVIMKGEWDNMLLWPFNKEIRFIILDQNNNKHIQRKFHSNKVPVLKPTSEHSKSIGYPEFVSLETLYENTHTYIKNDTLIVKVIVT